ncbi:hypothetical protein A3K86_07720 [Photobacterium jeanii]|uniref:DUF2069 domain-containing protein n=1 Tax=Photobacterium jeanii TaxID=858640 RepID=A0A178KNF8_9GAMM|nr:DUF2069 domain-containing protein [Photobacterium jeanii]OAN18740.1 hypothetical protein A3K86_07720 [Photobacterium jeanii]PST86284.1 DUF2069 domain-containing protein [Photobacterium jeanii]
MSTTQAMSPTTQNARYFALTSHLTLILWIALWQGVLSPHPHLSNTVLTLMWVFPLLLPLKGILEAKPYTHAWANFVLMFYFLHGLTILWIEPNERWLAGIELIITSCAFIGNIYFARLRGRELGTKLPRLSQVEKEERERHEKNK